MNNEMNNNGENKNLINVNPIMPGQSNGSTMSLNDSDLNIPVNTNNIIPVNSIIPIQNNNTYNINNGNNLNTVNNVIPVDGQNIVPDNNQNITITSSINESDIINQNNTSLISNNQNMESIIEPSPLKIENIVQNNASIPINNSLNINQTVSSMDNNISYQNSISDNVFNINYLSQQDKEDLLRAFIGIKYDKIEELKFSIPGFFFNITYMFYRKMFIYSLLGFILVLLLSTIMPLLSMLVPVGIGLLFKPLYINFSKAKVTKIIEKNKDKTKEELIEMCGKKGGTSIGLIFLGGILETIIIFIYLFILSLLGVGSLITSILKDTNIEVLKNNSGNVDYESKLYNDNEDETFSLNIDTNTIILDEFNIDIPEGFNSTVMNSSDWLSYEYVTDNNSIFNTCQIDFYATKDYTSSEKLIKDNAKYNDSEDTINTININNIKWDGYLDEYSDKVYYNATSRKQKVFLFKYTISDGADKDKCESFYQDILKSISIK